MNTIPLGSRNRVLPSFVSYPNATPLPVEWDPLDPVLAVAPIRSSLEKLSESDCPVKLMLTVQITSVKSIASDDFKVSHSQRRFNATEVLSMESLLNATKNMHPTEFNGERLGFNFKAGYQFSLLGLRREDVYYVSPMTQTRFRDGSSNKYRYDREYVRFLREGVKWARTWDEALKSEGMTDPAFGEMEGLVLIIIDEEQYPRGDYGKNMGLLWKN